MEKRTAFVACVLIPCAIACSRKSSPTLEVQDGSAATPGSVVTLSSAAPQVPSPSDTPRLEPIVTHFPRVASFSPEGKYLATESGLGSLGLWSLPEGALVDLIKGDSNGITDIAWKPKGGAVAFTGHSELQVVGLGPHPAKPLCKAAAAKGEVFVGLAWPSPEEVSAAQSDGGIYVYSAKDCSVVRTLRRPGLPIDRAAWSADGRSLALFERKSQKIAFADAGSDAVRARTAPLADTALLGFWFSPDGKTLASITNGEKGVRLWNASSAQSVAFHELPTARAQQLAWSPDGRTLAVAAYERVLLVEVASGKSKATVGISLTAPEAVAWDPEGKRLAVGGDGLEIVDSASGKLVDRLAPAIRSVDHVVTCAHSKPRIAVADSDTGVQLFDLEAGTIRVLGLQDKPVGPLAFRADDGSVVALHRDGHLSEWDFAQGVQRRKLELAAAGDKLETARFDSTGTILALRPLLDPELRNANTGTVIGRIKSSAVGESIAAFEFSQSGARIAVAGPDKIVIADTATGAILHSYPMQFRVISLLGTPPHYSLAWLPGDKELAIGIMDPDGVDVHDAASGKLLRRYLVPPRVSAGLRGWSPNGRIIDLYGVLADVESGKLLPWIPIPYRGDSSTTILREGAVGCFLNGSKFLVRATPTHVNVVRAADGAWLRLLPVSVGEAWSLFAIANDGHWEGSEGLSRVRLVVGRESKSASELAQAWQRGGLLARFLAGN